MPKDWIDWVCERTGYGYYDIFLEETSEEEISELEDEYAEYCWEILNDSNQR